MTKREALQEFRDSGLVVRGDPIWTRENWNNWVDYLQKDGQVTEHQASTWSNPF